MTFKELERIIQQKEQQQQALQIDRHSQYFKRFKNTQFWPWNLSVDVHKKLYKQGKCRCFNCLLPAGWPKKNGIENPLFSYQKEITDTLERYRTLYLLKAGGIGASELFLRYMAWLCLRDDALSNSQMVIITGPRVQLSISLIDRMKKLFYPSIVFDSKETVIELNKTRIEAFPSHSIESARGLPNVSFILADESDFWNESEEQDVRAVIERYGPKSHPFIALISTANRPDGLMDTIRKEPEETCLYKRLFMDYRVALGKLYTQQEIEQARKSPSFEREFCLSFTGQYGNVHSALSIDRAIALASCLQLKEEGTPEARKCLGIDVGWGSSAMAFCLTQSINNVISVLYAEQFMRPDYDSMLSLTLDLLHKYYKVNQIMIDSSAPEFISGLKRALHERPDYLEHAAELKKRYPNNPTIQYRMMKVHSIPFSIEHRRLLSNVKQWLDDDRSLVAIPSKFDKLLMSIRTATASDSNSLDKQETVYDDLYDAFRLSMNYWIYEPVGGAK